MKQSIKVYPIITGHVYVDKTLTGDLVSKNPLKFTGLFSANRNRKKVPVRCYLIVHPKGNILFDTGLGEEDVKVAGERGLLKQLKPAIPEVSRHQLIDRQLAERGMTIKDIDYIVISHMHSDHVGGLQLLKGAERIIAGEEEVKASRNKIFYDASLWKDIQINTFKSECNTSLNNRLSYDLFDDGSIVLVSTPGHTHGLYSMVIKSLHDNQYIVLGSDVAYQLETLHKRRLPGISVNKEQAAASVDWMIAQHNHPDCKGVYFTHDVGHHPVCIEV